MSMNQPVIGAFKFSDFILSLVLEDLTNEQAIKRTRNGNGASVSWSLGHLMGYRCQAMSLLGSPKEFEYKDVFGDSADDGSNYPVIKTLKTQWFELAGKLEIVLQNAGDEKFTVKMNQDSPHDEKRVLDTINFYMWHEAYHFGYIGHIRKDLGLPSTAELVTAAS